MAALHDTARGGFTWPALMAAALDAAPGMFGEVGEQPPAGVIRGFGDSADRLSQLVAAIAAESRHAGPAYWAARSWGMLMWQPTLLALLSVHRFGMVPRLDTICQRTVHSHVRGYWLPEDCLSTKDTEALIDIAGGHLHRLSTTLLGELRQIVRIKPVIARRLLADRLLGTLAMPGLLPSGTTQTRVLHLAERWLVACGLEGCSSLTTLELSDGTERLTLERKACCFHYRFERDVYCASCPRQCDAIRLARLREEWEDHVQRD